MDSTSTLAAARTAVFGKDPALGTDGQPLERGVGSPWHRADQIAKAHFHAATAWQACDELVASAKAILASAERISAAVKASIECAAAAKAEVPTLQQAHEAAVQGSPNISLGNAATPIVPPEPVNLSFDIPKV